MLANLGPSTLVIGLIAPEILIAEAKAAPRTKIKSNRISSSCNIALLYPLKLVYPLIWFSLAKA